MKNVFYLVFLILTIGCSQPSISEDSSKSNIEEADNMIAETSCTIYGSRKWRAWLDKLSDTEDMYRLNVVGEVDLPSPGYSVSWLKGITDRMSPPGQRLSLTTRPSQMMSIQVITPTEVTFSMDTPISEFRDLSIYCGEKKLVSIPNVVMTN